MTAQPLPALTSGDPSAWDQALYAFLVEKGNRSGSRRTVESYSRMLWPFFAERSLTPERVKPADVLAWVHGIGRSGRTPSSTTVGARIACLSSYFRFLIRMGLVVVEALLAASPDSFAAATLPYQIPGMRRAWPLQYSCAARPKSTGSGCVRSLTQSWARRLRCSSAKAPSTTSAPTSSKAPRHSRSSRWVSAGRRRLLRRRQFRVAAFGN
jgi:hypothetical protein